MERATRRSDPASRLLVPRLLAGAFAGLVGGLAFGVLMTAPALAGTPAFDGMGMMGLVSRLVGTDNLGVLWALHAAASAAFGALFGLLVRPARARRVALLGLAWGALLWLVNAFLLLRLLVGEPLRVDAGAAWNLLGHLAYGGAVGLAYVAFFREEVGLLRDHGRAGARRPSP